MRLIVLKPYSMNYSTYVRDDVGEEVETVKQVKFMPGDIPGMGRIPSIPDIKEDWEDEKGKKKKISKAQILINLGIMREYGQTEAVKEVTEEEKLLHQLEKDSGLSSQEIKDFYKNQKVLSVSKKVQALEELAGVGVGGGNN
jgi:hypothetical protein